MYNLAMHGIPSQLDIEHRAAKAQWLSAKMGLITLCCNCRREIFLPEQPEQFDHQIQDCSMPRMKWTHVDPYYKNGRLSCWNDLADGTAWPMNDNDLQDYHEWLTEHDYYLDDYDEHEDCRV
jgi:hypothetical protein